MFLEEKISQAIWIGKSLFERNKVSGSSANMSFIHDRNLYITASGSCFGNLKTDDFSTISLDDNSVYGKKPSKELPLHYQFYKKHPEVMAVIHTHSTYATLCSCIPFDNQEDFIQVPTPYLKMRLGRIKLIPYAQPGSQELFDLFSSSIGETRGYILEKHGPVVGAADLMQAFYDIEELEESAKIMWLLNKGN
jgi:ribulose-5-phosphate 4-epimerase/fuculose-1-phosphate aldolase